MDYIPYLSILITVLSGLIAFFYARSGERNEVGGIGWVAAALIVVAGSLTLYQTHQNNKKAAAAREKADELQKRLATAAARQQALVMAQLGGFDMSRPVESGSFYFDIGRQQEGEPYRFAGFVGPFPALTGQASGTLQVGVPDAFSYEFTIKPGLAGTLQLKAVGGGGSSYLLRETEAGAQFSPLGDAQQPDVEEDGTSGHEPAGTWDASGEDYDFGYFLSLSSGTPLRGLVARLAKAESFGRLSYRIPGISEGRKKEIVEAYTRIVPFFVFSTRQTSADDQAQQNCVTRIRVPMTLKPLPSPRPEEIVFNLAAAPEVFDTEVCGYVP